MTCSQIIDSDWCHFELFIYEIIILSFLGKIMIYPGSTFPVYCSHRFVYIPLFKYQDLRWWESAIPTTQSLGVVVHGTGRQDLEGRRETGRSTSVQGLVSAAQPEHMTPCHNSNNKTQLIQTSGSCCSWWYAEGFMENWTDGDPSGLNKKHSSSDDFRVVPSLHKDISC